MSRRHRFPEATFRATTQRRWPDSTDGPWLIEFWWGNPEADGPVECVGIAVRSVVDQRLRPFWAEKEPAFSEPQVVTTTLVRALPWASLIDAEKAKLAELHRAEAQDLPEDMPHQEAWRTLSERVRPTRPVGKPAKGRPPIYGPEHWARVAALYKEHQREHGSTGSPTKAVREAFGVPATVAGKWVARCRQLGLIPPARRSDR